MRPRLLSTLFVVIFLSACRPVAAPAATDAEYTEAVTLTSEPTATRDPRVDAGFLEKNVDSLRVMTYNVNWDSIFPAGDPLNHDLRWYDRSESFARILSAIQPDVLCLQEINSRRDPEDLALFLDGILDTTGDQEWQAAMVADMVIATRFDLVTEGYAVNVSSQIAGLAQAAALVDFPDADFATDVYVVCAHFKSGGEIADIRTRQRQADALMRHLRDAVTPGELLDLPAQTPIVLLGDFNVYETDPARHLDTLISGDIDSEEIYGPDFAPDWDETSFADLLPSHNGAGADFYTWRDDSQPFAPGALDRILFSDSVLSVANAFVFNTRGLTADALSQYGLQANDVLLDIGDMNFDHLPLVVDFIIAQP